METHPEYLSMMQVTQNGIRRIGEILVAQNVLREWQVEQILEHQQRFGRPFGDLAERLFGIRPAQVENAWVEQYLSFGTEIDLDEQTIDAQTLRVINRRQAWQFRMLPLSREDGEMIAVTSRDRLRRAVSFAWRRFDEPVYFLIAAPAQLERFLMKYYPWPGAASLPLTG